MDCPVIATLSMDGFWSEPASCGMTTAMSGFESDDEVCQECDKEFCATDDIFTCQCSVGDECGRKFCGCNAEEYIHCSEEYCFNIVCDSCSEGFSDCECCAELFCCEHFQEGLCKDCGDYLSGELDGVNCYVYRAKSIVELRGYAKENKLNLHGAKTRGSIQQAIVSGMKAVITLRYRPSIQPQISGNLSALLRVPVTSHKDAVVEFRGGKDLYTKKSISKIVAPEVDHIVECQVMASASLQALRNDAYKTYLLEGLKKCLNPDTLENYNVCDKPDNIRKGSITKEFLKYTGTRSNLKGFEPLALEMFGEKVAARLSRVLNQTYPAVIEAVGEQRREGFVTGEFGRVHDELENIFNEMDLTST